MRKCKADGRKKDAKLSTWALRPWYKKGKGSVCAVSKAITGIPGLGTETRRNGTIVKTNWVSWWSGWGRGVGVRWRESGVDWGDGFGTAGWKHVEFFQRDFLKIFFFWTFGLRATSTGNGTQTIVWLGSMMSLMCVVPGQCAMEMAHIAALAPAIYKNLLPLPAKERIRDYIQTCRPVS